MNVTPLNPTPVPQSSARDLAALEDEITELAAHLNAATYRLLTLIREFDERIAQALVVAMENVSAETCLRSPPRAACFSRVWFYRVFLLPCDVLTQLH